jgi:hypothetical protein
VLSISIERNVIGKKSAWSELEWEIAFTDPTGPDGGVVAATGVYATNSAFYIQSCRATFPQWLPFIYLLQATSLESSTDRYPTISHGRNYERVSDYIYKHGPPCLSIQLKQASNCSSLETG